MFQQIWERGGNPKVILTGYDTLMRLQQLLQSQQRFMEEKRVTPTYNGVKGVPGMEAGFIVATYNGVPIIPTKDMDDDGNLAKIVLPRHRLPILQHCNTNAVLRVGNRNWRPVRYQQIGPRRAIPHHG